MTEPGTQPSPHRKRRLFPVIAALVTLISALGIAEIVVRFVPDLLPAWYRARFPVAGIEFFVPGVLARTPIEGVPLPYRVDRDGKVSASVPRDLEMMGLVDPNENPDHQKYDEIIFPVDRRGFVNPTEFPTTDLLLVGDSFAVAAGVTSPKGLQLELSEELSIEVFNLGIPAIGPVREEWLLNHVGLELQPRAVAWFFFGGNDLADAAAEAARRSDGIRTYADFFAGPLRPRWYVWDFLNNLHTQPASPTSSKSLDGFIFQSLDGPVKVWFNPSYLRALGNDRKTLESSAGWKTTKEILQRVADNLRQRKIPLVLVYIPSKPQVYLEHVEPDVELAFEMAAFGSSALSSSSPDQHWDRMMTNKNDLEQMVEEYAQQANLAFISLTPWLSQLATAGELGFLSGDTHWNDTGQRSARAPLVTWWRKLRFTESVGNAEQ